MNKLKSILKHLIQHNFVVAFGALALYFHTLLLVHVEFKFSSYPFLLFFASLLDYNIHKLIKMKFQHIKNVAVAWQIDSSTKTSIIISFFGTLFCFAFVSSEIYFKLFIIGVITLVYSLIFASKNKHLNAFKRIPMLKTTLVAFVWTYLTLNIPVELLNYHIKTDELTELFISRFLFISAILLPFDLRDKASDSERGIVTLAHILTPNQIKNCSILMMAFMNLITTYYFIQSDRLPIEMAYVISSLLFVYLMYSKKLFEKKYYYNVLLDGLLIVQFVLVYLFSNI